MSTAAPETPAPEAAAAAAAAPAAAEPPKPAPPATAQTAAAPAGETAAAPAGETPEQQIARLTKDLESARGEAGKSRVNAKEAAAEEARNATLLAVTKALGIEIPGEKPDPEKLLADLATERGAAREIRVELAVMKAATGKADAVKLLDRNSFTSKLSALDPKDKNFDSDVAKAIDEAIKNDPTLKASGQAPGASAVPAAGGSGENGRTRVLGLGAAVEAARQATTTT